MATQATRVEEPTTPSAPRPFGRKQPAAKAAVHAMDSILKPVTGDTSMELSNSPQVEASKTRVGELTTGHRR